MTKLSFLSKWRLLATLIVVKSLGGVMANASVNSNCWDPATNPVPMTSFDSRALRSKLAILTQQTIQQVSVNNNRDYSVTIPVARKITAGRQRQPFFTSNDRLLGPTETFLVRTGKALTDTLSHYVVGFCAGYAVGALVGLPALLFRPSPTTASLTVPTSREINNRLRRINIQSLQWGQSLGEVWGIFKGCDTAVRFIRYPKQDEWNYVFGCASAGALSARNQGPVVMIQAALLWGTVIYVLEHTSVRPASRLHQSQAFRFRGKPLFYW